MLLLKHYYKSIIKHESINKFFYKNLNNLPKIKKITLNLGCNTNSYNLKNLATIALSLELVAKQKGKITLLKSSKISVKIRKGYPVGCKITLRKNTMHDFFFKLLTDTLPKIKHFFGISLKKKSKNTVSFKLINVSSFNELEKHHNIFKNLQVLDITFVTNTTNHKELLYLLHSYRLPILTKFRQIAKVK